MSTNSLNTGPTADAGVVERAVMALRRSFFLSFAVFGAVLIVIGYTFEVLWMLGHPVEDGILAGMFAIWGATAFLIGSIGYGTLRYLRNY
jgi:hypothetical protein